MREVGGAVERIDNPSMLARAGVRTAFFGEDRVAGKRAVERADDGALGFVVGFGHQIDRVGLAGDLDTAKPLQMDPAGRACGAERHLLEFGGCRSGFGAHRAWTLFEARGRYPARGVCGASVNPQGALAPPAFYLPFLIASPCPRRGRRERRERRERSV